jgi:hypothetical protein
MWRLLAGVAPPASLIYTSWQLQARKAGTEEHLYNRNPWIKQTSSPSSAESAELRISRLKCSFYCCYLQNMYKYWHCIQVNVRCTAAAFRTYTDTVYRCSARCTATAFKTCTDTVYRCSVRCTATAFGTCTDTVYRSNVRCTAAVLRTCTDTVLISLSTPFLPSIHNYVFSCLFLVLANTVSVLCGLNGHCVQEASEQ